MWKKYIIAASTLLAFSANSLQAQQSRTTEIDGVAEARIIPAAYQPKPGNYFIICAATKDRRAAFRKARKMRGFRVINTNRYPNLTNGLYAVVSGPYDYSSAWDRQSAPCYVKSGW